MTAAFITTCYHSVCDCKVATRDRDTMCTVSSTINEEQRSLTLALKTMRAGELARSMHVDLSTVHHWRRGTRRPSATAYALASLLWGSQDWPALEDDQPTCPDMADRGGLGAFCPHCGKLLP